MRWSKRPKYTFGLFFWSWIFKFFYLKLYWGDHRGFIHGSINPPLWSRTESYAAYYISEVAFENKYCKILRADGILYVMQQCGQLNTSQHQQWGLHTLYSRFDFLLLDFLHPRERFRNKLLTQVKFKIFLTSEESVFSVEISCTKFRSCPTFLHRILELSFYIHIFINTYVFH